MFDLTAILNIPDLEPSEIQMGLSKGGYAKLIARGETKDGKEIHPSIIKSDVKLSSVASNPSINSVVGKPLTKDAIASAKHQGMGRKVMKGGGLIQKRKIENTKRKIKSLQSKSSQIRKDAAAYNKETSGRAVANKGRNNMYEVDKGFSSTFVSPMSENRESAQHRKLLNESDRLSKEAKKLQGKLPKKEKSQAVSLGIRTIKDKGIYGIAGVREVTNIPKSVLTGLGMYSISFETGQTQKVYAQMINGGDRYGRELLPVTNVAKELIPYLKFRLKK